MKEAVALRAQFLDRHYHALILTPDRLAIAEPSRPRRWKYYTLEEAKKLVAQIPRGGSW
jgi:hypothetical protein